MTFEYILIPSMPLTPGGWNLKSCVVSRKDHVDLKTKAIFCPPASPRDLRISSFLDTVLGHNRIRMRFRIILSRVPSQIPI